MFSVGFGVLLALLLGLLLVFGIFAPILSVIFGLKVARASAVPTILPLIVFADGFGFYFGGMLAGYYARQRRVLHGVLVAVTAFGLSPAINLVSGRGAFPAVDTAWAVALLVALFAVSLGAAYIGARRGAALYSYNLVRLRKRQAAKSRSRERQQ